MPDSAKSTLLKDRAFRDALIRFVRAKVPESDAEDIVQAALTEAVASTRAPEDAEEFRKWVFGVVRHKVADHFRGMAREGGRDSTSSVEAVAESAPLSARELLLWAERELPPGEQAEGTLDWMLREGDGEKLEHIASEEKVEPARVRQRVSRLRRFFRERWAAQLAAVAAVLLVIGAAAWLWRNRAPEDRVVHVPPSAEPSPVERAEPIRRLAMERCHERDWERCIAGLDEAARLDPIGDTAEAVQQARRNAREALTPPVPSASAPPVPSTTPAPSPSATPPPPPTRTVPTTTHDSSKAPKSSDWSQPPWGPSKDGK